MGFSGGPCIDGGCICRGTVKGTDCIGDETCASEIECTGVCNIGCACVCSGVGS